MEISRTLAVLHSAAVLSARPVGIARFWADIRRWGFREEKALPGEALARGLRAVRERRRGGADPGTSRAIDSAPASFLGTCGLGSRSCGADATGGGRRHAPGGHGSLARFPDSLFARAIGSDVFGGGLGWLIAPGAVSPRPTFQSGHLVPSGQPAFVAPSVRLHGHTLCSRISSFLASRNAWGIPDTDFWADSSSSHRLFMNLNVESSRKPVSWI